MKDERGFDELKGDCPWHYDGECRAMGDFVDERDSCNEDNCAPVYWILKVLEFTEHIWNK